MEYNKYKCVLVKESSCEYNFLGNNAQAIYNASKDLHITDLAEEVFYIFCTVYILINRQVFYKL